MKKTINILMVEDSSRDAELIEYEINKSEINYNSCRVETKEELIRNLEQSLPDVILCDFHLPAFNAIQLLEITRKSYPNIPVIVVSGAIGEEKAVELLKKGASDYILKQNLTRLNPTIQRVLRETEERNKFIQKDKEIFKIRQHIEQIEKLEFIGQLAGGIAHDFSNYLQAILGHSHLGSIESLSKEQMILDMKEITQIATKAGSLTKQLLVFSRKNKTELCNLNLNNSVKSISKILFHLIKENIEIDLNLEDHLDDIYADSVQVEQIIINLCVNAQDAMPKGGRINISTKKLNINKKFTDKYPWAKIGSYIRLKISDNGIGIETNIINRIFEPFFTTKKKHKGTGMGLSTVYGIVKKHKGFMEVQSKVGSGSEFEIYLPVLTGHIVSKDENGEKSAVNSKGNTILIVEDNESILETYSKKLKREGYEVVTAANGLEALSLLNSGENNIDLVFIDVIMPKMCAIEVYEKLQSTESRPPFLFTSGFDEDNSEIKQILDMGLPFIQKPYLSNELLRAIELQLTQKTDR